MYPLSNMAILGIYMLDFGGVSDPICLKIVFVELEWHKWCWTKKLCWEVFWKLFKLPKIIQHSVWSTKYFRRSTWCTWCAWCFFSLFISNASHIWSLWDCQVRFWDRCILYILWDAPLIWEALLLRFIGFVCADLLCASLGWRLVLSYQTWYQHINVESFNKRRGLIWVQSPKNLKAACDETWWPFSIFLKCGNPPGKKVRTFPTFQMYSEESLAYPALPCYAGSKLCNCRRRWILARLLIIATSTVQAQLLVGAVVHCYGEGQRVVVTGKE